MSSRSQVVAEDVSALLRSRSPLLWIVTREEARVESYLVEAAAAAGYIPRMWDTGQGVTDLAGLRGDIGDRDAGFMLQYIDGRGSSRERCVWIMRDLGKWLDGPIGMTTVRQVRNLARKLPTLTRDNAQAIIVLSTTADVPADLAGHTTVIEWPMPDRDEIAAILDSTVSSLPEDMRELAINGSRDSAIDAAMGLSGNEAAACYAKSLVMTRKIDAVMVAQEKKRIIAGVDGLEWFDPLPGGLDAVGGLDNLKSWLVSRKMAYTPEARAYGLPAPRGALLVGVSGCGKSLTAKAIATAWGVPLLKLDLGAIKSKFVGDSEAKLRRVFNLIDAIGRCVVWLDELEKAMAGATDGSADGGVSADTLGTFLSWAQDRKGESFVMATANDVSKLPPELMRKGRFDDVWFVDLPTDVERQQVLEAALASHNRLQDVDVGVDLDAVSAATDTFTGAEIAALVPDAMYLAFADNGRELTTADLLAAAKTVVPLAKTASEKVAALRAWAAGRARPATTPETRVSGPMIREVDLDPVIKTDSLTFTATSRFRA